MQVVVVLPDSFRGMRAWRNSTEPTVGPRPKVWTRGKMEEVVPKMAR